MRHIGRTVLLGIWMLWGATALAENPAPPEDLNCKGECKKKLEACFKTCEQRMHEAFRLSSCAMAAGMAYTGCREQCELAAKGKK
ncbi:MAG TPA: hypothetical protein VF794_19250 [Archangium sp.]|jgi:hypothetical protein|uniref:hypothetical protein n=1 Tax=Archangium sp. TaxID=1872627 RepID=UPI002EDABC84